MIDAGRMTEFSRKKESIETEKRRFEKTWIHPGKFDSEDVVRALGQELSRDANLMELLRRPEVGYHDIVDLVGLENPLQDPHAVRQLESQARYSGYI